MATKMVSFNFRLKEKQKQKLVEIADKKDITPSDLARKIVENYLEMQ